MVLGSAIAVPLVLRQWWLKRPLAQPFLWWFAASYGLGIYANTPSILRVLGVPESVCASPLMNLFLLNPLVKSWRPGGELVGGTLVIAIAFTQYAALLLALAAQRKKAERHASGKIPHRW